jgi:FAD/FMN-containing dehydrogenase
VTFIGENTLQTLEESLRGELLRPDEPGYDESRSIWNAMIDRRLALIARCLGVGDVVTCLNFAREEGIPLSIKGGGHNISGLSVADGALTIDMSLMRGVWVDRKKRVAQAQPGCVLGDVDRETQLHGLAAVLGFVSKTGIAGLTLGGGFGYLSRRWGWTSDNVLSIDVVTAEGEIVRASDEENEDLFWGLRGGGGGTSLEPGPPPDRNMGPGSRKDWDSGSVTSVQHRSQRLHLA